MPKSQRTIEINPTRLVSELTVGELLDIIEVAGAKFTYAARVCVNFDPPKMPGPVSTVDFLAEGVSFSVFPGGEIVDATVGTDLTVRRYLALYGTGFIQIDFPMSKQVDLFIANVGGDSIEVVFYACKGSKTALLPTINVDPENVVRQFTRIGQDICQVRVKVTSAECLIWKFCYVPQ